MNQEEFSTVLDGHWERRPRDDWRFRGLCSSSSAWRPGQTILVKSPQVLHGVAPKQLHPQMHVGGFIVAGQEQAPRMQGPLLRVDSVQHSLRSLAGYLRSRTCARLIAVTGTVGKTSSCHLLRHVIGSDARVTMNGQLNSGDGILCEMGRWVDIDFAVIEISIQALAGDAAAVVRPHVGLLTQVSPVHTVSQVDLLTLTVEKAGLFRHLEREGTAVINRDITHFACAYEIAREHAARVITFGVHPESDFQLVRYEGGTRRVVARIDGRECEFRLGVPGRHMAINSLGVLAAATAAGVPLQSSSRRLATASPVRGRGSVEHFRVAGRSVTLIDDSYNASPASMEAAFVNLADASPSMGGRRIVVLGDMLELGDDSAGFHERLLDPLVASGADKAFVAGEMMQRLWTRLPAILRGGFSASVEDLLLPVARELRDGDVVLLKGSHGAGVYRLVEELRYLALFPDLPVRFRNVGLAVFTRFLQGARASAGYLPLPFVRWAEWQLRKRIRARVTESTE